MIYDCGTPRTFLLTYLLISLMIKVLPQSCTYNVLELNEPGHEKMCLMSYANNKGADQPVHPRSLISAFVVRCLDSMVSLDSLAEISRL